MDDHDDIEDSSDSEDDDYVPSGEESDVSIEGEVEESKDEGDTIKQKGKCRNSNEKTKRRKRELGLEDDEDKVEGKDKPEEIDKERVDSLWADFLKDVDPPPKKSISSTKPNNKTSSPETVSQVSTSSKGTTASPATTPKKVTITKVYDFAGESVTITKEVDSNSKEAKEYLSQQSSSTGDSNLKSTDEADSSGTEKESPKPAQTSSAQGVKRVGGVGNLVGQILKKKQKLNTLEKSKLDWDVFKQKEGIDEELRQHNKGKDGYLERQAFLERTDLRQFEVEKSLRMKNRSNR